MHHRDDGPGSRETLAALYDTHAPGLYRYALMILADPAAAQDAVHEAFRKVVGRETSIRSLDDYLRTAVRNECFTLLRRRRREPARGDEGKPLLEPVAPEASHEQRLVLESALRDLPPEQREVVHLKVYEGLTYDEIARRTETPLNTVASRYRYAIAKLREGLLVPARARKSR
jgi:RNA polymerase sigma-70 factor (ECF subfamily)